MNRLLIPFLALLGACTTRISGLMPIEPAPDLARVDTLRPTLRWEPLPEASDPRITELVYDVQVMDAGGGVLSEQRGLTICEFQLDQPLAYGRQYRWTVRARFRWEGRRRETTWTHCSDSTERLAVLSEFPVRYPAFVTPESPDAAKPAHPAGRTR